MRVRVTIAAPPERVWGVLTDLASYRMWHPLLELLDGPDALCLEPGATVRFRLSGGVAGEHEFEAAVIDVAKPRFLAWEGGDREQFLGRHQWTLTPVDGGTEVLEEEIFSGTLARTVLDANRTAMYTDYERIAAAFKAVVEGARLLDPEEPFEDVR